MGCADSRLRGNSSEIAITFAEKGLRIDRLYASFMDEKLRKYSELGYLNQKQLDHLSKKWDFRIKNYENHPKIEDFFNTLKTQGDGKYELRTMIVLFILLGRGDSKTKAKLLFEAFDPSYSKILSVSTLKQMFESISYMSLTLGKLVVATQTPHSHASRNDDYLYNLSHGKAQGSDVFLNAIMKDNSSHQIDRKHFIKQIVKFENANLLSSLGTRNYLKKYQSSGQPKYSNPFKRKTDQPRLSGS
jgi:hypothetical protein